MSPDGNVLEFFKISKTGITSIWPSCIVMGYWIWNPWFHFICKFGVDESNSHVSRRKWRGLFQGG